MEDFKDVMLSEPPARVAAAGGGGGNNAAKSGAGAANISNSRTINNQSSKAGASSLGADTTGADFSAYKGILLCDRPVDRTQLGAGSYRPSGDGAGGALPFLPSGKQGVLEDRAAGLPPSLESRSRLEQQRTHVRAETKKAGTTTGALAKHRRWLRAFAANVKEITQDQQDANAKRELVRQHIREKEAQKRAEWFTQPRDEMRGKALIKVSSSSQQQQQQQQGGRDSAVSDQQDEPSQQQSNFSVTDTRGGGGGAARASAALPVAAANRTVTSSNGSSNNGGGGGGKMRKATKKKPMWAMTEDEELDAEFEDTRDLLDFASSLDYSAFAKDMEVREAMAILQQRVKEIAAAQKIDLEAVRAQAAAAGSDDEGSDDDDSMTVVSVTVVDRDGNERKAHQLRPRKRVAASPADKQQGGGDADPNKPGWDATTKLGAAKMLRAAVSSESFAIAEKLLAENPALRQVHSKYSLSRMLQQVALQGRADTSKNPFGNTAETQGIPFAGRLAPPIIASIAPEAGTAAAARDMSTAVGGIVPGSAAAEMAASAGGKGANNADQPAGQPAVHRRVLVDLRKSKTQTQNLPYLYRHPGI